MLDIYFDGRKVASLAVSEDLLAQIDFGSAGSRNSHRQRQNLE